MFFRQSENINNTESTQVSTSNVIKKLRLQLSTPNNLGREIVMGFSTITSDEFDYGYDAKPYDVFEDDLTMMLDNNPMVIQCLADVTPEKEVDLFFKASSSGSYSIQATEIEDFEMGQEIFLRDNLTGVYFDLTSNQEYSFSSETGDFPNRFDVVFQNSDNLSNQEFANNTTQVYFNSKEEQLYVKGLKMDVKSINLYNILGQKVFGLGKVKSEKLQNGIQISHLNSGIYIVSLVAENETQIDKKIIVN